MTDTLSVDTLRLAEWRGNPEFDYPSEFKGSDFSLLDWLRDTLEEIMHKLFGDLSLGSSGEIIWYVLGFGSITAIIVFTLYRHPELLHWHRKQGADDGGYTVVEDNIYGIDFPSAISRALALGDYREAVRLTYLQTGNRKRPRHSMSASTAVGRSSASHPRSCVCATEAMPPHPA